MTLREILYDLASKNKKIKLNYDSEIFDLPGLLETLPEAVLNQKAYLQPGLYIAEMNEQGFLGEVLYSIQN